MEQSATTPFTDEEAQLLRGSFLKMVPVSDKTSLAFYETLFATDPSTRALFTRDIEVQGQKFMMMLAVMLDALDKPDKLVAECRALGASHSGYGVTTAMYGEVGGCLLDGFSSVLGDDFNAEVQAVWSKLYGYVSGLMMSAPSP